MKFVVQPRLGSDPKFELSEEFVSALEAIDSTQEIKVSVPLDITPQVFRNRCARWLDKNFPRGKFSVTCRRGQQKVFFFISKAAL
jgi:hypothetical protein